MDPNYCEDEGYVVGAHLRIPDDPSEFFVFQVGEFIGCNQLRCGSCGRVVRQQAGLLPRAGAAAPAIYEAADWASADELLRREESPSRNRLYCCACMVWVEDEKHAMVDPHRDWDDPALPWRCQGHPLRQQALDLQGLVIEPDADVAALAGRVLKTGAPDDEAKTDFSTVFTLKRLYASLLGTTRADELSIAVAELLAGSDATLRRRAAMFFTAFPKSAAADRVRARLRQQPDLLRDVNDPILTDLSMRDRLQKLLEPQDA